MNTNIRYYDGNVAGGWYCANCGAFVPLNANHECAIPPPDSNGNTYWCVLYSPTDHELLAKMCTLLEKILERLEK